MRTVTLKTASELCVGDIVSSFGSPRFRKAKVVALEQHGAQIKLHFGGSLFKWCNQFEELEVCSPTEGIA